MADRDVLLFRHARLTDAPAIAQLHADSWRRHYRGAFSDAYLDGDVVADRMAVWQDRLRAARGAAHTLLAEQGDAVVGFVHTIFDDDPHWGALLDNLHVSASHQRLGIGAQLVRGTAEAVTEHRPGSRLYLWVLEQNERAQAFYRAMGGNPVERADVPPPGGDPARLNGSPTCLRFVWPDPRAVTLTQ